MSALPAVLFCKRFVTGGAHRSMQKSYALPWTWSQAKADPSALNMCCGEDITRARTATRRVDKGLHEPYTTTVRVDLSVVERVPKRNLRQQRVRALRTDCIASYQMVYMPKNVKRAQTRLIFGCPPFTNRRRPPCSTHTFQTQVSRI